MHENQKTLGELIAALERAVPSDKVLIDWNDLIPGTFRSYRGYYEHLALDFEIGDGYRAPTVEIFLRRCRELIGTDLEGYKGGTYVVDDSKPIWIACWGRSSDVALTGFLQASGIFWLETTLSRD